MSLFRTVWRLLPESRRRGVVGLLGLMLIGMVLETIGLGLIIPAVGILATSTDIAAAYPSFEPWLAALGYSTQSQLVVGGMIALVAVFAVKTAFMAFLAWRQSRFAYGTQAELSQQLFTAYMCQPWPFHLQRNSAQLIRNVTIEVGLFGVVIQSGLVVLTECLAGLGIWVLLLIVEPVGAVLVVTTMGAAGWGFQRLTRAPLVRWGQARQHHEGLRFQHLQQGLGGVKEVKLLGREEDFLARYRFHNLKVANVNGRHLTVQQLPRLWLELLAVVELAVLVLVMMRLGKPIPEVLPTLGVFAAAAFRILPSANRVLASMQAFRYNLPVVKTLDEEMRLVSEGPTPLKAVPLRLTDSISLQQVGFRYANAASWALQDITLTIGKGKSVGFVGGSGAGKSTLIDLVLGLLLPGSGVVLVDGVDIQTNLRGWQDQIGYVPQTIFLTDDSLRRNVAFGLAEAQIDEAAVARAIRAAQLEDFVSGLPDLLETVVGERGIRLSGGQRQRIGIARALYHDPAVVVLDEATSSLDVATENEFMRGIYSLHGEKTLLIVAHRLSTVAGCDRLFRLENGRLVEQGDPTILEKVARLSRT